MTSPHPALDRDLTRDSIIDLTGPDALAAFFAELGYHTDSRIEQTPGNLGIHAEGTLRPIRSIQLLAEQEDGFQVYLFELASVTVAHTRALARAFRDRAGIFLLVLTSDFETIDFVFLERYLPSESPVLPGLPLKLVRPNIRPRVLTIQRRNAQPVDLRVLRRFTWTESDGYAQHDKIVAAYGVADWSEPFFNNRALFSDHYLLSRFQESPEWEEDPKPAYRELRQIYRGAANRFVQRDCKALLEEFLVPGLSTLGFAFEPGKRGPGKPRLEGDPPSLPLYAPGGETPLALCLPYPWGRSLDAKDDRRDSETPDVNPGAVVVRLLERGETPWVILTNGRIWRLYARRAHSRATNYYEIDLGEVLDATGPLAADPNESFRYFWLLFRRRAFELHPVQREGKNLDESFLDSLLVESQEYARKLGDSLKEKIFDEVVLDLAAGFASDLRRRRASSKELSQEDLDLVFRGTLTFLYRLLFLLYAEARDLLPVREVRGYHEISLARLRKEVAAAGGPGLTDLRKKIVRSFKEDSFDLYARLARLFQVIDLGDADVNVPIYNGGLFLSNPVADDPRAEVEAGRFLLENRVPDSALAYAIDRLARDEDHKSKELVSIDYKSLGVRQIGSIYEGLLEFRLRVAHEEMAVVKGKKTEEVIPLREAAEKKRHILKNGRGADAQSRILKPSAFYLENDKRERKATGSYYTPDFVVEYIVEKTVGPLLNAKLEALRPRLRDAEQWHRKMVRLAEAKQESPLKYESGPAVDREWETLIRDAFDFKVLDPAMGSGHFLVEAVDFITDKILDFLSGFPWNPVFAHLASLRKEILDEMEKQGINIDAGKLTDVNLLKRHVLKRCIFGVDLNQMAVELAKVSLWLDCFTLGAPLSFLDHHLRIGNSLLGVTVKEVEDAVTLTLFGSHFAGLMSATQLMSAIGGMPDVTGSQVLESRTAFENAVQKLEPFVRVLDIYTTRWFSGSAVKAKGKKGQGLTEIDFLKASETQPFLRAEMEKDARKLLQSLPADDKVFAETALGKAKKLRFFHWELGFPEVFYGLKPGTQRIFERLDDGGFDAVIGNPPWIRQEGVREMKPAFEAGFLDVFASEADIYTYFLARGIQVLRPGGRFGMILQNKWFKAGYARRLRDYLAKNVLILEVVDFGHAPLFEEADTFPCILLLEKPNAGKRPEDIDTVAFVEINREGLPGLDLGDSDSLPRVFVPASRLQSSGWELLSGAVGDLMEKVRSAGQSLREYLGCAPLYGIKTGFNEAFFIDQETRKALIQEDPSCGEIIRKFIRGDDIERWSSRWEGEWMIFARRGIEIDDFPSIKGHLLRFRESLEPRPLNWDKRKEGHWPGRKPGSYAWFELQDTVDYYKEFYSPKIIYKDIDFHSAFSLDEEGLYLNNTCYFLPSGSRALLAILNSSLIWWFLGNLVQRGKDEAFRLHSIYMERVPIPFLSKSQQVALTERVEAILRATKEVQNQEANFSLWFRGAYGASKLPIELESFWLRDAELFLKLVGKRSGSPLFEDVFTEEFLKIRNRTRAIWAEIRRIEIELHHLVFDLYRLNQKEIHLVRETAPPRDPLTLAEQELANLSRD